MPRPIATMGHTVCPQVGVVSGRAQPPEPCCHRSADGVCHVGTAVSRCQRTARPPVPSRVPSQSLGKRRPARQHTGQERQAKPPSGATGQAVEDTAQALPLSRSQERSSWESVQRSPSTSPIQFLAGCVAAKPPRTHARRRLPRIDATGKLHSSHPTMPVRRLLAKSACASRMTSGLGR